MNAVFPSLADPGISSWPPSPRCASNPSIVSALYNPPCLNSCALEKRPWGFGDSITPVPKFPDRPGMEKPRSFFLCFEIFVDLEAPGTGDREHTICRERRCIFGIAEAGMT